MTTAPTVTVVGRVITDVTARVTTTGDKVANFRIACQERHYDKELGLWVDGDRMYIGVACWRKLADGVTESLSKGDQVVVNGRLKIREYTADDGARRASPEIDARAVGPDLARHTVLVNRPSWEASPDQLSLIGSPPTQVAGDEAQAA